MDIKVENIQKSFGKLHVLKGINHEFAKGKVTCILGPNGSGKTTLMKSLMGLVKPDNGEIIVDQKAIGLDQKYREKMGYVAQIARFPENLKTKELFHLLQEIRKVKGEPEGFIADFALEPFLDKKLKSLSGGTRQKVNLVTALMFRPEIYILDEPTSGLDPVHTIKLKDIIRNEINQSNTVIITTHLLHFAQQISNELLFLIDGKIKFSGSPEQIMKEQNAKDLESAIAQLLKSKDR